MTLRVMVKLPGADGKVLRVEAFEVDAQNPLTFGRAEGQNRLAIPDEKKMISSRHGRIERRGNEYYVVDLKSLNGTQLNGRTVEGEAGELLTEGSTIGLGSHELRVFLVPDKATSTPVDSTLHSFDPDRAAAEAWEQLCADHARLRGLPAAERRAQLQSAMRARLKALPPPQARSVCKRVSALAGGGEAATAVPSGEEEMLQAALVQLKKLGAMLCAGQKLGSAKDVASFAQLLENFLQLTLRWLVACMQARAEFENQFGAEVTMVFQRSNNPLKGLQAADIGRHLFDWTSAREPVAVRQQLENICRDLTQHQLGLLVGVKEAVAAVVQRLSPEAIESLAQKDAGWLTSKGAKAWDVYRQIYREFFEEKSKLFHEVISPAIRQGYLQFHQDDQGRKKN